MLSPQAKVQAMLRDPETYGTTILVWALDALEPPHSGRDEDARTPALLTWHPAVLRREIQEQGRTSLPDAGFDRLMAAITVLTTDLFTTNAGGFATLTNALCGDGFRPAEFDPPEVIECAWAITEALLLDPPEDDAEEVFADPVRAYLGMLLKREGFLHAPDILGVATGLDLHDRIRRDHGDDPELLARIEAHQRDREAEVTAVVRDGLRDLVTQLEALPLHQGSTRDLAQRLRLSATTTS